MCGAGMVLHPYVVLAMLYVATIVSVWMLYRAKGFEVEERGYRTPSLVSPSVEIVKLVARECIKCRATIVAIASFLTLSLLTASTVSYAALSTEITFRPSIEFSELGISKSMSLDEVFETAKNFDLVALQIYSYIEIYNRSILPLALACNARIPQLQDVCRCVAQNRIVVHETFPYPSISIANQSFDVCRLNLSELLSIEFLPGIYFVHSVGVVGTYSVKVSTPEQLIIIPLDRGIVAELCKETCVYKVLALNIVGRKGLEKFEDFDIVAYPRNSKIVVMGRGFVPTMQCLVSIALSIAMSLILTLPLSSAFIERVRSLYTSLLLQGVSKDIVTIASGLGMWLTAIAFLPLDLAILLPMGTLSSTMGLITYVLAATMLSIYVSKTLSRQAPIAQPEILSFTASVVLPTKLEELDNVVECLRRYVERDDFLELSEIEKLPLDGRKLVRIEMLYRRAMAVLVSVEIEFVQVEEGVEATLRVDVWSLEELDKRRTQSIALLGLSKIVGALRCCSSM